MGAGSKILPIFFCLLLIIVTLCCIHILIVHSSMNAAEYFNHHGLRKVFLLRNTLGGKQGAIEGSRKYLIESREGIFLEKFRALLGAKSFSFGRPPRGDFYRNCSPFASPSPSPSSAIGAEAPAPSPVLKHFHRHTQPPSHHPLNPEAHKLKNNQKGKPRRILTAILVSSGVSLLLCSIGLFWGCWKFRKQRRKSRNRVIIHKIEAGCRSKQKIVTSQTSVKKVTSAPGADLFYIDSLGLAFETQELGPKQSTGNINTDSNQDTSRDRLNGGEESDKEAVKFEPADHGNSDAGEIIPIHETTASIKYKVDDCKASFGEIVPDEEAHSSDDESFHSVCDSHSSNIRLSNASASSLNDSQEIIIPPPNPNATNIPPSEPYSFLIESTPPAPLPAPPPMPSHVHNSASKFANSSSQVSPQSPQKLAPGVPPPPPPPTPPCLPQLLNGNTSSHKAPPPPPPPLSQHLQLGQDGAPLPKLKPLHWDKVRAAPDRSTVWDKLKPSSFEFDEQMIESLFGYNIQNSIKAEEAKSKTPSPTKHVLEPKRLQNITILSKALNPTADQVCDALIEGIGLSLQDLEALARMAPTQEEEAKLLNYKGDINELVFAERFVMTMLKIPFAFPRIEAMLYRETFEDEVIHLGKSFSMLEEACKELRSSRLFLKLLEAVLKTGNRMNVGTIRGGAKAFKLDALLKLADVKGTDGKTTLLHFVVQEIVRSEGLKASESIMGKINQRSKSKNSHNKEEDYRRMGLDLVSGLSTELCNVKRTASIDFEVLASSVSNLSDGMKRVHNLVNKDLLMEKEEGNFVHSMRSFLNHAEKKLKELQQDENGVLLHVREITEYFHGNVSKDEPNPLRIFVIVRDFLGMLDHVCKELRSLKAPTSYNPLAPFR